MDLSVFRPCDEIPAATPWVKDPEMFRAECPHGSFAVCSSAGFARRQALDHCWRSRTDAVFAAHAAGVRFTYEEKRQLAAWKLIPHPSSPPPPQERPMSITQAELEDLLLFVHTDPTWMRKDLRANLKVALTELLARRALDIAGERKKANEPRKYYAEEEPRKVEPHRAHPKHSGLAYPTDAEAKEMKEFIEAMPKPKNAYRDHSGLLSDKPPTTQGILTHQDHARHICQDPNARFDFCEGCRVELAAEMKKQVDPKPPFIKDEGQPELDGPVVVIAHADDMCWTCKRSRQEHRLRAMDHAFVVTPARVPEPASERTPGIGVVQAAEAMLHAWRDVPAVNGHQQVARLELRAALENARNSEAELSQCSTCNTPNAYVLVGNAQVLRCTNHPDGYLHCPREAGHADGCPLHEMIPPVTQLTRPLYESQVQWVVNDLGELGVKIGPQFFFFYKAGSIMTYCAPHKWRPIYKREFGEVIKAAKKNITEICLENSVTYDESGRYIAGAGWKTMPPSTEGKDSDD